MNREMKFRVWDNITKRMWYPKFALFESGCVYSKKEDYELLDDAMNGSSTLDEDDIVMQYTGLKDKNGKEIYENDILKDCYGRIMKVIFSKVKAKYQFQLLRVEGENFWANNFMFSDMEDWFWEEDIFVEIIGNIYDNPELLEVE